MHELSANRPGPFIQKSLRTACALIGENGDTPLEFIRQNPSKFCKRLSNVKLGDESNCKIVQSIIGDVAERIEPLIIQEYSRIYIDILGLLPLQIIFRILVKLDDKALGIIPIVSRQWTQILTPNQLWKLLCHHRGWGIIFTPPKVFEWRKFYRRMSFTCRRRLGAYQQSYDKEIHGIMGLK